MVSQLNIYYFVQKKQRGQIAYAVSEARPRTQLQV